MSERCILYPNDLNYLNYSPKYLYSGTGDVLLVRDNHNTKHVFICTCRVNCLAAHKGLLWYTYEWRLGWAFDEWVQVQDH